MYNSHCSRHSIFYIFEPKKSHTDRNSLCAYLQKAHSSTADHVLFFYLGRVAMAQGKQGIWMLTFPDRENTGNSVNLIFYTGKILATQGKF